MLERFTILLPVEKNLVKNKVTRIFFDSAKLIFYRKQSILSEYHLNYLDILIFMAFEWGAGDWS